MIIAAAAARRKMITAAAAARRKMITAAAAAAQRKMILIWLLKISINPSHQLHCNIDGLRCFPQSGGHAHFSVVWRPR